MAEIRRGREWSHPPWEPCALATMQEGPYMSASMSRSVLVFPRSPFLLFLRFKRGGSRERCCALKAWQLLRLAALSGQVPKPAGARRSRREDLKAKARPGDNGCLPIRQQSFVSTSPVSIWLFVSRSVKAKHRGLSDPRRSPPN